MFIFKMFGGGEERRKRDGKDHVRKNDRFLSRETTADERFWLIPY